MYILAFKDGHDPAACLMKDGSIVAAVEEERFNRVKHAPGKPPFESIRYCLSAAGITLDDVDYIVYASSKAPSYLLKIIWYYLVHPPVRHWEELRDAISYARKGLRRLRSHMRGSETYQRLFAELGGRTRAVEEVDHHLSHAASAYYFSGLTGDAAILTMDGKGDSTAVYLGEAKEGSVRTLRRWGVPASLGLLYTSITKFLGFEPNEGEYKVMGLAPYGTPQGHFDRVFNIDPERGSIYIRPPFVYYKRNQAFLAEFFSLPARSRDESMSQAYEDLAASLQEQLEESVLNLVRYAVKKTGKRTLCMAGGVCLNVKMNKRIRESGLVDTLWVQPVSGDAGTVIGAAAQVYVEKTGKLPEPMRHLYFGPEYGEEEILQALQGAGLSYERPASIAKAAADVLAGGGVLAWFEGRMEFGPRALGARSIVADPRNADMKERVNEKIKFRELFRPFCPSILDEDMADLVENPASSPYMIMAFDATKKAKESIPAVVHVDGTMRVQEVVRNDAPMYWDLIKAFKEKSGVGAVLDTSLNRRGEPIVNTPQEAINLFLATDLDAMALGPFLVKK